MSPPKSWLIVVDLGHQLLPVLKRLEAERDKLVAEGDPIDYARRVLARQRHAA